MYRYLPHYKITYLRPVLAVRVTIKGLEHYTISYYSGIVINTNSGRIIKGVFNNNGYRRVYLCEGRRRRPQYIHRLVAFAFIPNKEPFERGEVNHINHIRSDCNAFNLEWVTKKYNLEYRYCRRTKKYYGNRLNEGELEEVCEPNETPEVSSDDDLPF